MSERDKYLNIYNGEHAKIYQTQNVRGKLGGGYGRICWGEGMLELLKRWCVRSLLDVGCGYGNFCNAATLFAERVYGLDIASVATGQVIDNPHITFFDGQAKSLPLEDGAVEWITSFDCLEHCLEGDIDDILNEFARVAKNGFALSISYEPCDFQGVDLHMTVRPESWWMRKLSRFGTVTKEGRVPITGVPYLICRKPVSRRIICYCAGRLSSRLKALAAGYRLAGQSGRELAMVWQENDPLCDADYSDLFANAIPELSDDELMALPSCKIFAYVKDVANQALISGNQTLSTVVRKWGSFGLEELNVEDVNDDILVYYGQDCDMTGTHAPADFIHLFEPIPKLKQRINDIVHQFNINKHIMGVHARGSDFCVGVKVYAQLMIKALEMNPAQRFLVCSDEERYEVQLAQVFGDKVITRPKSGWVQKIDDQKGWSLGNITTSRAAIAEMVIDLYLLSRTDFRIYHESSEFAKLCKMLSTPPDQRTSPKMEKNSHHRSQLENTGDINGTSGMAIHPPAYLKKPVDDSSSPQIYYCCPDVMESSAGIRRLYRHVSILRSAGFPASILHHANGFNRRDLPSVPVRYLEQIGPDPDAVFVIPEGMPKTMLQLKDHPGRRFVIALSWHYIFSTLPDGLDWRHLGIERVLAVSTVVGRMVSWSMGLPVHILDSSIDHRRYFHDPGKKLPRVSFIQRKAVNMDRLKRLLWSRNPDYIHKIEWNGLNGLSEADYADQINRSSVFVSTSMAEGYPTSCLEAMAAGAVVAGYDAVGGKGILCGDGPNRNCLLAPNGDYISLAYVLEPVLRDMINGRMENWSQLVSNAKETSLAMTAVKENDSLVSFWRHFLSTTHQNPETNELQHARA